MPAGAESSVPLSAPVWVSLSPFLSLQRRRLSGMEPALFVHGQRCSACSGELLIHQR